MLDLNRPPLEEIAKRASEVGPGLAAAAKAQGLQQIAANAEDCRQRTAAGQAARLRSLGMEDLADKVKAEPMGNVLVTGDLYGDRAVEVLGLSEKSSNQDSPAPPPPQEKPTPMGTLAKLALGAALLASGAGLGFGVPWLLGAFNKLSPPPAEFVDTDTTTSIGIGGGEPTVEW